MVIGQTVEDHINDAGKIIHKPGGIYYSAAALVNIMDKEDELFLCTSMEIEKEELFNDVYNRVNKSFFNYSPAIPVVHLTIHTDKERDEQYENIIMALDFNTELLKNIDAVYINMVTGFDLTIDKLEEIREKFKGLIYIDIHTLSRGFDEDGKRQFRKIPESDRWIKSADIIQVNEQELFTLSSSKDAQIIIEEVLQNGPEYLIVTKGGKGAEIFFYSNNEVSSFNICAIKINTLNNVGCGDVFGAVYFYYYVKEKNFSEALKKANIAAGLTASYRGFDEFSRMKDDVLSRYN